uniref:BTB domain-containing protein n=1 Tax=Plectus sambesii TaxID=2011161 RepID=A0A914WZ29_9BILA
MPLPTAQGTSNVNPMSFTENQHGNVVLERLRQQRESGRFCDVFLVVHDRQFSAHRNILAACSPYFDSILKMHKVVKEQVTVNCQNPEVFELLLNYMYSGSVVIDRSSVMELLKLSNNFLVTKLKNYCAEYLDRYLDAANCLTVKELASKYNMPGLLKNACEYLEANINRCLLESNDILEYSLAQAKHLLADPNYRLTIAPDVYLRFIARWVGRKVTERESLFKELLSGAPLAQVGRETFVQLLDFEPLFDNSETARFALLQAMYENSIPLSKYESQYQALLAKHSGEVNIYFNDASMIGTSNGVDGSVEQGSYGGGAALRPSPLRVEPLLENHHHQAASAANASPIDAVVPTSSAPPALSENSSTKHSNRPVASGPRDPMSYIPMVMPIVKQELSDTAASGGAAGRVGMDSAADGNSSRDQPPVLGGPTTLEATILNSENVAPSSDHLDSSRPALKLTLRLPLINRKNRLLGKHKQYRKSVTTANQTLLNKRRGRPPKFRTRMRADMDSPFYPDCGINLDETMDDFGDEEDDGALVVDEGNGDEAGTSGADGATAEISFRCPNCIYTANTQSRITAHIARAHSRNVIFVCSVCQYECKWNRE